jgi:hypothetical protein
MNSTGKIIISYMTVKQHPFVSCSLSGGEIENRKYIVAQENKILA